MKLESLKLGRLYRIKKDRSCWVQFTYHGTEQGYWATNTFMVHVDMRPEKKTRRYVKFFLPLTQRIVFVDKEFIVMGCLEWVQSAT